MKQGAGPISGRLNIQWLLPPLESEWHSGWPAKEAGSLGTQEILRQPSPFLYQCTWYQKSNSQEKMRAHCEEMSGIRWCEPSAENRRATWTLGLRESGATLANWTEGLKGKGKGANCRGCCWIESISHAHLAGNHLTIYKSMFKENLNGSVFGPPRLPLQPGQTLALMSWRWSSKWHPGCHNNNGIFSTSLKKSSYRSSSDGVAGHLTDSPDCRIFFLLASINVNVEQPVRSARQF